MLQALFILFYLLCPQSWGQHLTDEAIYTINGKKVLHTVSERFVSFSIDPAILLTGLNLSETTLQMAKHLAPAYVRIAGPSTQFVKYQEENWRDEENGFVAVTPSMWFGINEWLTAANLTPVFGINDKRSSPEGWNPQEAMDVLDMADKLNVTCYWQLGYDCSNKTSDQYETDLKRLQHVLDAFPARKNQWRIVGSDISQCSADPRKILDDLSSVLTAVVQESPNKNLFTPFNDLYLKPKVPIWSTCPKYPHAVSFASAISWARDMGEAAKSGYEVVLRQPRLHEIYSETPPFWVSLFHKMLMGRNVLEVKAITTLPQISLYAHCTKHQNEFIRSGAMTVLVVNNCTSNHTVLIKFGTLLLKSTEVQSYILTSDSEDATDVFLNGEKLNLDMFSGDRLNVLPKLRRARIMNYLSLFLPRKSVGFFVLPSAQIPICSSEEESDLRLLMEEIREDQNIHLSDEETVEVTPRFSFHRSPTLRQIQEGMEKELKSDERYYKHKKFKKNHEDDNGRNLFIKRVTHKPSEDVRRHEELKRYKPKEEEPKKIFELELTSAEIRKVLSDRAKIKAARKNIIFTSEELEEIMNKATQKFLNSKNASIRIRKKAKREITRDKKDINMRLLKLKSFGDRRRLRESLKKRGKKPTTPEPRTKRDINMDLLKLKTDLLQKTTTSKRRKQTKKFDNFQEKQATIRQPGQKSEEFVRLEEDEEEGKEDDSPLPDRDVFADLARPDDFFTTTTERARMGLKPKTLFNLHKASVPKIVVPVQYEPKIHREDDFQVSEEEPGDFACIHEFFGKVNNDVKGTDNSSELWEVEMEEPKNKSLPSLANRLKVFEIDADAELEKALLQEYHPSKEDCIEDDYEDLESNESRPLRLKRDIEDINLEFLGKAYDPAKLKIDDNMKTQQYKMLKEHLYQKKKLAFINKTNKRKMRSLLHQNSFNERYKSLTEGLKVWRPADILTLKSPDRKKSKRSVDHDADSVENEIDHFMHELVKDTNMIKENGDYQLIFPNKDMIQVGGNGGDTEVKLVLHGDEASTTPGGESVEETTKTNIQKISKKHEGNIWDKLFGKLSKFFQGLSSKLKKCIMDNLLNGAEI